MEPSKTQIAVAPEIAPHPTEKSALSASAVVRYLESRPRWVRWREWLVGRRYRISAFGGRDRPLVVIAFRAGDRSRAMMLERSLAEDWPKIPLVCRKTQEELLARAPQVIVVELHRNNVCGCLGHRHVTVHEKPFVLAHDALGGEVCGELDIAYERVRNWQALPLSDAALDAKFLEGSRLVEFHAMQFRLRLLSVVLHEIHHLVFPREPERSVRDLSLNFYRDSLAHYVEESIRTLAFTMDRSFSRLG